MIKTTQLELWLETVNSKRETEWNSKFTYKPYEPLTHKIGRVYAKVMSGTAVWAFVSMGDNLKKGFNIGDLLKPASHKGPANKSRGNILNGTASWGYYGPNYL